MAVNAFQFQTGAIKSLSGARLRSCFNVFQFQTGAIKSGGVPINKHQIGGFNSKLVRLKVFVITLQINDITFQFQTGAIKRPVRRVRILLVQSRFNSKLVRLKGRYPQRQGFL